MFLFPFQPVVGKAFVLCYDYLPYAFDLITETESRSIMIVISPLMAQIRCPHFNLKGCLLPLSIIIHRWNGY